MLRRGICLLLRKLTMLLLWRCKSTGRLLVAVHRLCSNHGAAARERVYRLCHRNDHRKG
jgi:hypothetical protein